MTRREFIALIASASAMPSAAHAQQPAIPVIGFLNTASAKQFAHLVAGFHRGLMEVGFVEGQNVVVEYRWAEGQYDRVATLAADLARLKVAVIAASGGDNPALAAKAASNSIPVVFIVGSDPVRAGLVASLARPSGNITGVNMFTAELVEKRLGLLHEVIIGVSSIAVLINPDFAPASENARQAVAAARAMGKSIEIFNATNEDEIEAAFRAMAPASGALLVAADPFFNSQRHKIVALAASYSMPAIYEWREFAEAGGLFSYGTNLVEAFRQQGRYTGRILKGEKPSDLPVIQLTKFELVINLKSAKALGVTFPPGLLAIADDVIE